MNNFQVYADRVQISKQDFSGGVAGEFRIINVICTLDGVDTRVSIFVPASYIPEITIEEKL